MNGQFYAENSRKIKNSKYGELIINLCNSVITYLIYAAYFVLLFIMLIQKDFSGFLRIVLTTGLTFMCVSLFRRLYNAQRPYERFDYKPALHKDSKGKSFPSRHVFSVFIIGMAYLYLSVPAGVIMLTLGVLIACIRFIGGVHFIKDVLAGAILGIGFGFIGFFLIP